MPPRRESDGRFVDAFKALRKVRRARTVARFNGWSMMVFAAPAVLFGLFSLSSLIVGIVLALIARRELRWGERLGALQPRACGKLAQNQIVLLAGVLFYCGWQIYTGLTGPSLLEQYPQLGSSTADLGVDIEALNRKIVLAGYTTVAVLSIAMQGATAWYYASRRAWVQRVLTSPSELGPARDGASVAGSSAAA